jgi:deoxycytidylate deaminase
MEALRIQRNDLLDISPKSKTTREKIEKTYTEEIVVGICAPIGTPKEEVIQGMKDVLQGYGYETEVISLSILIQQYYNAGHRLLPGKTEAYSRLKHKIEGGNHLRTTYQNCSVLAELAIKQINLDRNAFFSRDGKLPTTQDLSSRRKCYIIDSLKNREELLLFRSIYKELFYCFSIFSSRREREDLLSAQGLSEKEMDELILTDDFEANQFGQDVRNTFTEADFFLRVSNKTVPLLVKKITRYFHIIFESKVITPHAHEYAMYVAKSAAGNSACLSRQVGASIMGKNGTILSKGWNDVPQFGGNLYHEENGKDQRCFLLGHCSNDRKKDDLTHRIIEEIEKNEFIQQIISVLGKHEETKTLWQDTVPQLENIVRTSRVKDLIEFSRSVHAEMHAIITGSQLCGDKIVGSTLFTTTYPCHNCARHIIVAGITEVYYIEPYVKSLCLELHKDAITENEQEEGKVKVLVYDGVAPRRYLEFFTKQRERKDKKGIAIDYESGGVGPKFKMTLQALATLEQQAIHSLYESGLVLIEGEASA